MKRLEESFERWESSVRTNDTIGIVTNTDATGNNVQEIEELLQDLEETIRTPKFLSDLSNLFDSLKFHHRLAPEIVEEQRARFNIDDVEINSRKNFVVQTKKRVDTIKNELRKEADSRKVRPPLPCLFSQFELN